MLIASYNKEQLGDVLLTVVAPDAAAQSCEKKGNIVRIFDVESGQTTGYNFFNASKIISGLETKKGQVFLDNGQVDALNEALKRMVFHQNLLLMKSQSLLSDMSKNQRNILIPTIFT